MADTERQEALATALKKIEKNFGKGAIMKMGDKADTRVSAISSGSLAIDEVLGVGGLPRGRIVEMYGPESSGETTVALHAVAMVQQHGGTAAYIDAENAMDPKYATALVPQAEIDGDMGDAHVGLQARLMSQALRKLSGNISKTKTIAVFINQIREKVGIVFGNPEITPGGRALKFYATVRLEIRRSEQVKNGAEIVGNRTKIKVVKNKVAPPFKVAIVDIMYGRGISQSGELVDMAVEKDIVEKSGSWYAYQGERIGQGREHAKAYLETHEEMRKKIEGQVREAYGMPLNQVIEVDDPDESARAS
ncbi:MULTISPECIES: recombinase RecA [Lacticaseibacillus]|uniref:Protein RecA n=2 Tax=Lacticaseibacillus casei TaxID=1582 RepID=A0AAD1ANZ5_LACCA|nr:DNA recombination/repair protein RecA [Lacticaseibacillus casei]MBI6596760.1 DNA recombination/repair protein RecA [Lacticaseibacillus casei]MBO1480553.1 DNA recombination/repair protein RecA [Lacticaseibacillus casei]MBO2415817.1 DNA recombination/repair protein RecA [Lacticaseibacillus casei]MCK2080205.1 DNA recombination/repair protein RecA [Lacticaseibacillus casei]MDZ5496456.1 DNA recombination/repair protein RecA [Lacticaseibacillus casei]